MIKKEISFTGSWVALVTPMSARGDVDYACLADLIEWHLASGTQGIVIMGTTGESSLVSEQELLSIVEATLELVNGRIPVIAGCGGAATAATVKLVEKLNQLGVDGYLCVTPYYVKPSQSGLIAHYRAVADAANAPVLLYNVPGRTACDLSNDSVVSLAEHPGIVGIKDAVGDVGRARELFEQLGDDFVFFSGDDASAFEYIAAGGHGVISVTANLVPEAMHQWCQRLLNRSNKADVSSAKAIFDQLALLHEILFIEANPIPVKWALAQMGRIPCGIRLPLTEPQETSQRQIFQALQQSQLL